MIIMNVKVYSTKFCVYCKMAKEFLKDKKIPFEEVNVQENQEAARQMIREAVKNGNGNLQDDLQQAMKSFLFNRTRRRPMVFVTLSRS